jgi:CubicO group peptidase (beta-lactamase class C family)
MISIRTFCALVVVLHISAACSSSDQAVDPALDGSSPLSTDVTVVSSVGVSTTAVPVETTSTSSVSSVVPTTLPPKPEPLPNSELFDAAIKLHTLDAGSRDVSAAVVFEGQVVHTFAASTSKSSRQVNVDTNFRIASISKILTAVTVLKLVEQGELELDEPIVGFIADSLGVPLADERARSITIRQLLSHTSGISNFLKIFFDAGTYDQMGMLKVALGETLASEPGSTFKYGNVSYVLLGKAIERATGLSYQDATRQLVLAPLGLQSFRLVGTYDFGPTDALHAVSGGRTYMEQLGAAGGWVATATDVAKLLDSLDPQSPSLHIISEKYMELMKLPATPVPVGPLWDYGLGLRLFVSGEWGHSGSIENVHSMAVHRPDGLTVSVLVNGTKPKHTDDLIDAINAAVLAARTGIPATTTIAP